MMKWQQEAPMVAKQFGIYCTKMFSDKWEDMRKGNKSRWCRHVYRLILRTSVIIHLLNQVVCQKISFGTQHWSKAAWQSFELTFSWWRVCWSIAYMRFMPTHLEYVLWCTHPFIHPSVYRSIYSRKTNMSPEHQWLQQDVFPIETVPF